VLHLLAIAAGGAIGSLLRYGSTVGVHQLFGKGFPYGTLTVNVIGSLLVGILYVILVERLQTGLEWRALLITGLLGGFTTFSAFSLETLMLVEQGEMMKAALNIVLSVGLCLGVVWVGILIGRSV
jgi:fluoride exporter